MNFAPNPTSSRITDATAIGRSLLTATTAAAALSTLGMPSSASLGDLIYGSGTNVRSALAGNTTTTKKFLTQTGTGSASAAPAWGTINSADVAGLAASATVDTTNAGNITSGNLNLGSRNVTAGAATFSSTTLSVTAGDGTTGEVKIGDASITKTSTTGFVFGASGASSIVASNLNRSSPNQPLGIQNAPITAAGNAVDMATGTISASTGNVNCVRVAPTLATTGSAEVRLFAARPQGTHGSSGTLYNWLGTDITGNVTSTITSAGTLTATSATFNGLICSGTLINNTSGQLTIQSTGRTNASTALTLSNGIFSNSSGTVVPVAITPTINQTNTAASNILNVDPTVTAAGTGTQNIARFGWNGTQVAAISSVGNMTLAGSLLMPNLFTPASSSAAGTVGTLAFDASYLYACTAINTWKRAALSTF